MQILNNFLNKLSPLGSHVLRVGLGLVFVYFGYTGLFTPDMWTIYVPEWTSFIASAITLVKLHGIFEILTGILLIINFKPRLIASLLFLDLIHIIFSLEFGTTMVRDIGLACAMFAIAVKE